MEKLEVIKLPLDNYLYKGFCCYIIKHNGKNIGMSFPFQNMVQEIILLLIGMIFYYIKKFI